MHTDDSVFENHTSGGKGTGKAEIRSIVEGIFATFPDLHFEGRRLYVRDDLVVQEWTATATHSQPIRRAGKTYAPSGKKISWTGMDIIPMRGALVARKDVYADSITYLRQIGVELP
jgi:predicted ester cyclase